MSVLDHSARWSFPFLAVGQMQKEVTHNEALALIDMVIAPAVEAASVNVPPGAPGIGQGWLIGPNPSAGWAGQANKLACWTQGGWRYAQPPIGMAATLADGRVARFDGTIWQLPPTVAVPQGGAVVDSEARFAIDGLIAALKAQGWLSDLP